MERMGGSAWSEGVGERAKRVSEHVWDYALAAQRAMCILLIVGYACSVQIYRDRGVGVVGAP